MKVKEKKTPKHKDVLNLLLTAEGHLRGIEKMIKNDEYCIDISKQILAVNAILKKINLHILKKHLETCVKEAIKKGNAEEKIDELGTVMDYLVKGKS
ncbi:MAG: metal-sensing transcriptional repressor [Caldisericaceae bacterium]|nr:metal-sensing transcriptional repressor [Caldisericaceae bacterium]